MYWNAMQYLKTALKYEAGNHPIVHQCLGQSFIALGMLKVCYWSSSSYCCLLKNSSIASATLSILFYCLYVCVDSSSLNWRLIWWLTHALFLRKVASWSHGWPPRVVPSLILKSSQSFSPLRRAYSLWVENLARVIRSASALGCCFNQIR